MSAWRQQNGGYEWEPEDYEWRPTYLPLMRSRRADKRRFIKDDRRNVALNLHRRRDQSRGR
jgi:type III protein arginine methyltransferase